MLRTNLIKSVGWLLPALVISLSGCGLTQRVAEGTRSAVSAVFYKNITRLQLDFTAREALNTDTNEHNSLSQPVMIRIYQLKDRKVFDKLVYQQLLQSDATLLNDDLLASRDLVLKPGAGASLDMPMAAPAKFIAVVGLFRQPDNEKNDWKQVLEIQQLDPDKPRVIEAGDNHLVLKSIEDK